MTLEHADLHPEICDEIRRIQDRITGAITEGIEDPLKGSVGRTVIGAKLTPGARLTRTRGTVFRSATEPMAAFSCIVMRDAT